MKRPVVMIAIPIGGDGKEQFWDCVEQLRWHSARAGVDTIKHRTKSCYIHHNRNLLVVRQKQSYPEASWILFLDSDTFFEPNLLVRMMSHKKSVVTANYYRKGDGHTPVAGRIDAGGTLRPVHLDPDRHGLERVDSNGMGAVLVRSQVFSKVKFPWFENIYRDPLPREDIATEHMIEGKVLVGEDVFFFNRCKKAGINVYCDFSIKVGHIGDKIYDWRDYEEAVCS